MHETKEKPLLMVIGPSFTMALPMMLGSAMVIISMTMNGSGASAYMFTGIITAIGAAVMGVIWALTNLKYEKQVRQEERDQRYNAYGNYLIEIADTLRGYYESNRRAMNETYIHAENCCRYDANTVELWNRNIGHKDFLAVRLGIGSLPFQAEISIPKKRFELYTDELMDKPAQIKDNYSTLYDVPVCIDLLEKNLIGVVGGAGMAGARQVLQDIVAQIAVNNCYTEVKMAFLYEKRTEADELFWEFARWLPHVWTAGRKQRMVAENKAQISDVCCELASILRQRVEESDNRSKGHPMPHYVLFVENPKLLEGELLAKYALDPSPEYGLTTVLLAANYEDLPNGCEDIIQNDGFASSFYNLAANSTDAVQVRFDSVPYGQLEQLARRLADIEVPESAGTGEIPESIDFMEMHGVRTLDELGVSERWAKNRTYESLKALIGKKGGGVDCYLDIHEKFHGPHGLVAGTTGSGKSETLQTYMLSLAVNFSPYDIGFFIIDFKGGGMANLFSNLPHLIGQISNLSGNQVHRAMISIKSEIKRRQRAFGENNVNNINLYTRLYKNGEVAHPIPHLFIIIDEFAELKREEPDFMKELISVAQVGRSLGVHLILATQKPSGTVDDNIWSNSKFRLCLRVQDRQDSQDMLHKPDAAYITQAGRGYLQVGNDEIFEEFQSGYSGAVYDSESMGQGVIATMLTTTGKEALVGGRMKKKHSALSTAGMKKRTQLEAVVDYLSEVARENRYEESMALWLPVLPRSLPWENVSGTKAVNYMQSWGNASGKWSLSAVIGLYDDPENQQQEPFEINLGENGHYAVCGMVVSGKSTLLQTFAYAMMLKYSPREVNFYLLDFSSRMLSCFEAAPHVGGVVNDDNPERLRKFMHMLEGMMDERKKILKGGNYQQYVQANGITMPAIVVVIDNYAGFREKTDDAYEAVINRLSREGVGYGIFWVVSSGGFGSAEIPNRIGTNIRNVVALDMGDRFKFADTLRVTRVEIMPEIDVKGRGLGIVGGRVLEFQTAVASDAGDDYKRSEYIDGICKDMAQHWNGTKAKRIPEIPEKPMLLSYADTDEYRAMIEGSEALPAGYYFTDASYYGVSLRNTYCYTISGKPRTGKTNYLKNLIYAAGQRKDAVSCVIETGGTELARLAKSFGMTYAQTDVQIYDFFKSTVPVFSARNKKKRSLLEQIAEEEIFDRMKDEKPYFIFIADLKSFIESVYGKLENGASMSGYVENILERGSLHNFYFFA
ncbi:MAG: type VII secretion protein EssC, partial [Clostridiales bacterium]|nr:type VII secretion protein EssC [Clostridiales bacterium]